MKTTGSRGSLAFSNFHGGVGVGLELSLGEGVVGVTCHQCKRRTFPPRPSSLQENPFHECKKQAGKAHRLLCPRRTPCLRMGVSWRWSHLHPSGASHETARRHTPPKHIDCVAEITASCSLAQRVDQKRASSCPSARSPEEPQRGKERDLDIKACSESCFCTRRTTTANAYILWRCSKRSVEMTSVVVGRTCM